MPRARAHRSVEAGRLLHYDRAWYRRWLDRARRLHGGSPGDLQRLIDAHPRTVNVLTNQPYGFIHGEFYPSNILVEHDVTGRPIVRPLDWEMAAIGPPLMDVANLVAGRWTDDQRADLADAYHVAFAELGGRVPRRDQYLKALDCCLIHLALQNLGWSEAWRPPPPQQHDWLGEGVRLCEKWQL